MLIWTIYYYAMQYTGGFVDLKDIIVCGSVGLICVIEYYVDLPGMITSQNKEAVFAVIQKLKEAGAQRADIEKAIEYVCLCG